MALLFFGLGKRTKHSVKNFIKEVHIFHDNKARLYACMPIYVCRPVYTHDNYMYYKKHHIFSVHMEIFNSIKYTISPKLSKLNLRTVSFVH